MSGPVYTTDVEASGGPPAGRAPPRPELSIAPDDVVLSWLRPARGGRLVGTDRLLASGANLDQPRETGKGSAQSAPLVRGKAVEVAIEDGGPGLGDAVEHGATLSGQLDKDGAPVGLVDRTPDPSPRFHGVDQASAGRLAHTFDAGEVRDALGGRGHAG